MLGESLAGLFNTIEEAGISFVVLPESYHVRKLPTHIAYLLITEHVAIAAEAGRGALQGVGSLGGETACCHFFDTLGTKRTF